MGIKTLKIRPYARLLTMLGEQLIKNEQIALAELIKNSYDADADWVRVRFENFQTQDNSDEIQASQSSKIIIEDNGWGMDFSTIEKSWMNPATPNKKAKQNEEIRKTPKGRITQGEKGIGRFAILKLGRNITITTRPQCGNCEYVINYDLSKYDDDFLTESGVEKELFIDNIDINVIEREPEVFIEIAEDANDKQRQTLSGTRIEISNLKGSWDLKKIEQVCSESQKLESIFDKIFSKNIAHPFEMGFELNGNKLFISDKVAQRLSNLIENASVLRITDGEYIEEQQLFSYKLNGVPYSIYLDDARISGLSVFKERFIREIDLFNDCRLRKSECGDFKFNFFVFDFIADRNSKYYLDRSDKDFIKEHRIYLYRDRIRVAPYGDADNDWLETDKRRGTGRTGDYLSNDQVVGFVDITKEGNPNLKDKTNREGLIESGNATRDFMMLLHTFLLFIRQHAYRQYQETIKRRKEQDVRSEEFVGNKFEQLKKSLSGNSEALSISNEVEKAYKIERNFYERSLQTAEELAGVGLSVETASHDIMMMLTKGIDGLDELIGNIKGGLIKQNEIENSLLTLRGAFSFVFDQMKDIQLLFKSSKRRKKEIRIADLLGKVEKIYKRTLARECIQLEITKKGNPLVAKCTDAVILQLFINLFDNAIYWLAATDVSDKKISIVLDGDNGCVIFADNGPGIHEDDAPYIFEAFYSGKEEGRGLGLYIAKQLLYRLGYSISLIMRDNEKTLSGANFLIDFIPAEEND